MQHFGQYEASINVRLVLDFGMIVCLQYKLLMNRIILVTHLK